MKKRRKKKKPKNYGLVFGHPPRDIFGNFLKFASALIAERYIELRTKEKAT